MVIINNLYKNYTKSKNSTIVPVIKGISLTATPGQVFGLLGANGAGKTTILRSIATLLRPSKGTITVCGYDTLKHPSEVRARLGFLTSDMKMSGYLSVRELLTFFGKLNRLSQDRIDERSIYLATYLELGAFIDKPIDLCSTGQKQKVAIAVALIHDPEIIIFDEPTNGLDIMAAKIIIDFLHDCKQQGKTVLLSTHIFGEAQSLCDRIGIIAEGKMVANDSMPGLLETYQAKDLQDVFFKALKNGGNINAA
jgi:sodium transport system ATP-binding protein